MTRTRAKQSSGPHGLCVPDPAIAVLHDYSTPTTSPDRHPHTLPTLVVAPQALHDAAVADLAPHHSLMQTLQQSGLDDLTLLEWISATPETADHTISTQVDLLDRIITGYQTPINLVGLCQGGWLSLVYTALFPDRINRLVLAGAPVDFHAGLPGPLRLSHRLAQQLSGFGLTLWMDFWSSRLSSMTNPIVRGNDIRWLWPYALDQDWQITEALQMPPTHTPATRRRAIAALQGWDKRVLDLPAPYFWEVVQDLYRDNQLVRGTMTVLDRPVTLASVTCPLYLLAGQHDTIVPKEQVLAAASHVGTPPAAIEESIAPCGHLALFMGHDSLTRYWPGIANWLIEPHSEQHKHPNQ